MKKSNLNLVKALLLSFLGVAGMSMLKVNAAVVDFTSGNGLWNTGVEIDDLTPIPGDPTGNNNPTDLHYVVSYYSNPLVGSAPPATYVAGYYGVPTTTTSPYVANPTATDPYNNADNWVSDPAHAEWITYSPNMTSAVPATPGTAVTVYQLVLTGISTGDQITIGGSVAADDTVTIYANGQELYSDYTGTENGTDNNANYNQLNSLSGLTFVSVGASNDLDFVVVNDGAYATGFLAELTGSYTTQTVPEPSTYALLTAGLGVLVFMARRKIRTG